MKLMFIIPASGLGGAENVFGTYVQFARDEKWIVDTVDYSRLVHDSWMSNKFPRLTSLLQKMIALRKLSQSKPDFVFITTLLHQNLFLCILKHFGVIKNKIIIRETNNYQAQANLKKSIKFEFFLLLRKLFYHNANVIIVLNNSMRTSLNGVLAVDRARIRVVENPIRRDLVDPPVINSNDSAKCEQAKKFAMGAKGKVFYSVGSLIDQKNFTLLVHGFNSLSDKNDRLVIFGDGPERENLADLVYHLGINERVLFAGSLPCYGYLHKYLDIFVSTSHYEGSPNAMSEAITLDMFCVSADYDYGPNDLLKTYKKSCIFNSGRLSDFSEALSFAKESLRGGLPSSDIMRDIECNNNSKKSQFLETVYSVVN
ncbi:glycosyltransferase [Pseudomonadales bacterium]|nr:glycosyltransferase [Pseudomonadales bacterium]